ncbi:MAG: hypothetical protein E3J69_02925 [Anaerolineales bacterium]|nr:MAG: hypothetical protein E3J69_02925 [Anaerolineales bacterium]
MKDRKRKRAVTLTLLATSLMILACLCSTGPQLVSQPPADDPAPLEVADDPAPAAKRITITLDKDKGPTGSTVRITVTGANPGELITIKHSNAQYSYWADNTGTLIVDDTMVGQVGDVITITAEAGTGFNPDSDSADFTITGNPFASFYDVAFEVLLDIARHLNFTNIRVDGTPLRLWLTYGSLIIEGDAPWVTVSGDVADDGSFALTGRGVVAGFPGIAVSFDGTLTPETIEGTWALGTDGGLPQGEPISFAVTGEAVPEEGAAYDPVAQFYTLFNSAQAAGDHQTMYDLLHPVVLERYGESACAAYLESIVNPAVDIELIETTGFGTWDYERDERTDTVENTFTVNVIVHSADGDTEAEAHVAKYEAAVLGWFTDCGDPLE